MVHPEPLADVVDAGAGSVAVVATDAAPDRARAVLRELVDELMTVVPVGPNGIRISPVATVPRGALVRIDDLDVDPALVDQLADCIDVAIGRTRVVPDSVTPVLVDGPGELAGLDAARRAAVLRLFPPPAAERGAIPSDWLELASDWIRGDLAASARLVVRILGVEFSTTAAELEHVLAGCARDRVWCDTASGDPSTRVRTASLSFGVAPHLAMASGGGGCSDNGMLARFGLLADVARSTPGTAYTCLQFEPTFEMIGLGLTGTPWSGVGGASPNRLAGTLVDRYVPDVFPFQTFGAGHLATLGPTSRQLDPEPVAPGRWALALGAASEWLSDPGRSRNRRKGWELLDALLVSDDDLDDLIEERRNHRSPLDPSPQDPSQALLPAVAAAEVVVDPFTHRNRGERLSILELAAMVAGEPHSDAPESVAPSLRVYVRELAAGLPDQQRQALKRIVGDLITTAAAGDDGEAARFATLADDLVRIHCPAWLDAAGLGQSADRLRRLPPLSEDEALVRAVDLIGQAITTASRRFEITASLAGASAELVDAVASQCWEEMVPATGGPAAADALVHGIPGHLVFATDQRAMDCARIPEQRARIESANGGLASELWSTAIREVAASGWRRGWEQVEQAVRADTTFSVRAVLGTVLDADGEDDHDDLIDRAWSAAVSAIAREVLSGEADGDLWAIGVEAAGAADEGGRWTSGLAETRQLVGAAAFDDATAGAAAELAELCRRAPRLVTRVVVASACREACSIAGRNIAARAATDAVRPGATPDEDAMRRAAEAALSPVVDALCDHALGLIRQLVDEPRR